MNESLYQMYREAMVEQYIQPLLSSNDPLYDAFMDVRRHNFVPHGSRPYAYDEEAVPLGEDQMLSQPSAIARVLSLASLQRSDRVLDVGCGGGYQMALIAAISASVYGIERSATLAAFARKNLADAGVEARVTVGHGLLGLPEQAPFDAIVFGGSVEEAPHGLLKQLAPGGRLVAPIGNQQRQTLTRWTRTAQGLEMHTSGAVRFSPFVHPN